MSKPIWLDNSQVTKPSMAVISRMMPFFTDEWGVLSQPHEKGARLFPHYKEGLKAIYSLIGAKEEDMVLFTNSSAEAVNQVIFGLFQHYSRTTGKNHFIALETDEAPALMALSHLRELGAAITLLKPDSSGHISHKALLEALSPKTILCTFSYVSGLTGVIQPIESVLPLIKERGVKLHVEVSHAIGKIPISLGRLGADFLSFGGEKIHAPKATGALWIKGGEKLPPLIYGGTEQGGLRGGFVDMALFSGFVEACREAYDSQDLVLTEVARLRSKLERTLQEEIADCEVLAAAVPRAPHITALSFKGCPSELLLFHLHQEKLFATMGGGLLQEISASLKAQGCPPEKAMSALSFSLSRETSEGEIERAAALIKEKVGAVRKVTEGLV